MTLYIAKNFTIPNFKMLHSNLTNFNHMKFYLNNSNNSNLPLKVRIFAIKVKKENYHKQDHDLFLIIIRQYNLDQLVLFFTRHYAQN